jgi:hypothetical protein
MITFEDSLPMTVYFMDQTRFLTVFILLVLPASFALGQDTARIPPKCIDISTVNFFESLGKQFSYAFRDPATPLSQSYNSLAFKYEPDRRSFIPNNAVTKRSVLRFNICNSTDSTVSTVLSRPLLSGYRAI